MIAITGNVTKHGRKTMEMVLVPGNHTEASGMSGWGLLVACGLLVAAMSFIFLILFAA